MSFGVENIALISDDSLQGIIDSILTGLPPNTIIPENADVEQSGIGSLIASQIRGFEKGIIISYEPIIAGVRLATKEGACIIEGITTASPEKIASAVGSITDKLVQIQDDISKFSNPTTAVNLILENILEPLILQLGTPIPDITTIIKLAIGETINWDNFEDYILPPKLKSAFDNNEQWALNVMSDPSVMIKSITEWIMLPINFVIGMVKKVIELLIELIEKLTPDGIVELIGEIAELAANPIKAVVDLIQGIISPIIETFISSFIPNDVVNFIDLIISFVSKCVVMFFEKIMSLKQMTMTDIDVLADEFFEGLPGGDLAKIKTTVKSVSSILILLFGIFGFLFSIDGSGLLSAETILSIVKFPPSCS